MLSNNATPRNIILPLIILEALIFGGSVYLAVALRFMGENGLQSSFGANSVLANAIAFTSIMLPSMAAMGLYQVRSREDPIGMFVRVLAAFALGTILSIVLFYLFPSLYFGRGVFSLTLLFSLFAIGTIRPLFFQFVDRHAPGFRVLVLGAGEKASKITSNLRRRSDRRGIHIVGFLPAGNEKTAVDKSLLLSPDESLLETVEKHDIDEIVVA
ncbi:MAG TPA: hypothetical protein ENJ35_09380, partial [Gammaproteobacteria bacterium]|nr:hypothetical protein [Gammaproteobacteria bacterium]